MFPALLQLSVSENTNCTLPVQLKRTNDVIDLLHLSKTKIPMKCGGSLKKKGRPEL